MHGIYVCAWYVPAYMYISVRYEKCSNKMSIKRGRTIHTLSVCVRVCVHACIWRELINKNQVKIFVKL